MDLSQLKRYDKIKNEKFFLLQSTDNTQLLSFILTGSTGNIYQIDIDKSDCKISCNCPDHSIHLQKKPELVCKHCCFILFKVLNMYKFDHGKIINICTKQTSNFFNDYIFNDTELQIIDIIYHFMKNINTDNDFIKKELIDKYNNYKSTDYSFYETPIKFNKEDNCPICFDKFGMKEKINCPTCNNCIHLECIRKWLSFKKSCPYCRSKTFKLFENHPNYVNINNM